MWASLYIYFGQTRGPNRWHSNGKGAIYLFKYCAVVGYAVLGRMANSTEILCFYNTKCAEMEECGNAGKTSGFTDEKYLGECNILTISSEKWHLGHVRFLVIITSDNLRKSAKNCHCSGLDFWDVIYSYGERHPVLWHWYSVIISLLVYRMCLNTTKSSRISRHP